MNEVIESIEVLINYCMQTKCPYCQVKNWCDKYEVQPFEWYVPVVEVGGEE